MKVNLRVKMGVKMMKMNHMSSIMRMRGRMITRMLRPTRKRMEMRCSHLRNLIKVEHCEPYNKASIISSSRLGSGNGLHL